MASTSEADRRAMQLLMNELFGEDDLFVDLEDRTIIEQQTGNSKPTGHGISATQDKQLASPTQKERSSIKKGAAIKAKAPRGKRWDYVDVDDDGPMGRIRGADGVDFLSTDEDPFTDEDSTLKVVQQGLDKPAPPDRRPGAVLVDKITRVCNDPIIFSPGDRTAEGTRDKRKRKTKVQTTPLKSPKRARPNRVAVMNNSSSPSRVQIREDNQLNLYTAVESLISSQVRAQGRMFGDPVFNLGVRKPESRMVDKSDV